MSEQPEIAVPGWDDRELRKTASAYLGVGAEADLPNELRFLMAVVRLIRKRQHELRGGSGAPEAEQAEGPAIFFCSPYAPLELDPAELSSVPMLDNGLTPIGMRFWFVSLLASIGQALELENWQSDQAIFYKAVVELGLGELPAVVYESRTKAPEVRFYPGGLSSPDRVSVVSLGREELSLEAILDVVENAHVSHLVTPQGPSVYQLWQNARKHWPIAEAERRIQFILRVALQSAFPATTVREEQSGTTGRLDLEIVEFHGNGVVVEHALLELKVLRSFGSSGKPIPKGTVAEIVKDGVEQAAAYCKERNGRTSALCCFDMRTAYSNEDCFRAIKATARRRKVTLRVWHIFASAKEYRSVLAKAA